MSEESDPNKIRDVEIKRLTQLAELAYGNATDEKLRLTTRESWFQKFTNAVLALNQLLKDSQYAEFERRLRVVEESKRPRRVVLSSADVDRRLASATRKEQQNKNLSESSSNERIG